MFSKYSVDKKLVKKLLKGDDASFDVFYEEYFDKLYRFVLSRVGQHHTAEDIVQNSLFNAINKLNTYRGEASLLTWLCTFCRYEMSSYFKNQNKQESFFEDQPQIRAQIESLTIALQEQPENQLLQTELNKVIHMTLDNLPERYANVVELKYIQGLSVKEIALNMGVSAKAIESLLSRARPVFEDMFYSLNNNNKLFYAKQENLS